MYMHARDRWLQILDADGTAQEPVFYSVFLALMET